MVLRVISNLTINTYIVFLSPFYIPPSGLSQKCNGNFANPRYHLLELENGGGEIQGTMQEEEMSAAVIFSCSQDYSKYIVNVTYTNPNTRLSSESYEYFKTVFVFIYIYSFFLLIWQVNWFINFSIQNHIHLLLTIVFLLYFSYKLTTLLEYKHKDKSDSYTWLTYARIWTNFLS